MKRKGKKVQEKGPEIGGKEQILEENETEKGEKQKRNKSRIKDCKSEASKTIRQKEGMGRARHCITSAAITSSRQQIIARDTKLAGQDKQPASQHR